MLIRIESREIGSVEITTPDHALVGDHIAVIRQAIGIFSLRYHGRDRYDFLSILADELRDLREKDDGPADLI